MTVYRFNSPAARHVQDSLADPAPDSRGSRTAPQTVIHSNRPRTVNSTPAPAPTPTPTQKRLIAFTLVCTGCVLAVGSLRAQSTDRAPQSNGVVGANAGTQNGGAGGAASADFDTLIELIETTIAPDTWETVGGDGSIEGFPGGVYVDAGGLLRPLPRKTTGKLSTGLSHHRRYIREHWASTPIHETSDLRQVSLRALLDLADQRRVAGQPLDDAIRYLGGLTRIDYVAIDEDDVILAGPAGAWSLDDVGRVMGARNRPVLRFDDLITLLRNAAEQRGVFICSITPTPRGLRRAQQFIASSSKRSITPQQRPAWLNQFRAALGKQAIEVEGLDPHSRVARVIVEADYHMKRVGLGLEPSTPELSNYLQRAADRQRIPQSIDVLRWWFTLQPNAVSHVASDASEGDRYTFAEQTTRVLSENEFLAARGQRVPTGEAAQLNAEFARDFTRELPILEQRYPIYAELDNVFRLAIVANLLWQAFDQNVCKLDADLDYWLNANDGYEVEQARAAEWVRSVANDVTIDRRNFLAAVSGGVEFRRPRSTSLPRDNDPVRRVRASRLGTKPFGAAFFVD